jgi:3-oxoacyl-[acyl-carrier-protein] synthase-3
LPIEFKYAVFLESQTHFAFKRGRALRDFYFKNFIMIRKFHESSIVKNAVVFSTGSHVPERVVCNRDLTQFPESSLKLIASRTGVRSRRVAREKQCTSDLAIEAARACLARVAFPVEELEAIIVSTSSPDRMQPATATRVQYELGAHRAFAFDINSVCSGSVFGINLADSMIKSGKHDNILFIAAEMYSKILNHRDFSTFPFFGDGAGAVLFRADNSDRGVLHSCLGTDGSRDDTICVPAGGTKLPFKEMKNPRLAYFKMNGTAVFDFAVDKGTETIFQVCDEAGVALSDVDYFICHQANINIIREIASRTGRPVEKFAVNLDRYGNTASASVLIALDEALSEKAVKEGDLVVTVAFGGGLSWGGNLIRI